MVKIVWKGRWNVSWTDNTIQNGDYIRNWTDQINIAHIKLARRQMRVIQFYVDFLSVM